MRKERERETGERPSEIEKRANKCHDEKEKGKKKPRERKTNVLRTRKRERRERDRERERISEKGNKLDGSLLKARCSLEP